MISKSHDINIEALIASSWKDQHAGLVMSSIMEIADHESEKLPPTVSNWLAVYDEVGAWFVNLSMLMLTNIMDDHAAQHTPFQASIAVMVGNLSAQIIAIRRLVTSGLDVQAKQLLRILTEHVDIAIALSIDPKLAEEFELTLDGDTANKFWHKHMKKGKLREAVFAKLEQTMGATAAKDLMQFIRQEEKILGMTIHPSLAAAQMACLPQTGNSDEPFFFGFIGKPSIFSERTLSYAIIYLTLYIAVGFVPPERIIDDTSATGKLIGPFQKHVLHGRKAALAIVAYLIPHWGGPDLRSDLDNVLGAGLTDGK